MPSGDVVLASVQFTDTFEIKKRPAVILFEEFDNVVVVGITSNTQMKGIPLTVKEGAIRESVIKTNYIFTISKMMVHKKLFSLSQRKKSVLYTDIDDKISSLKD